MKVKLITGTSQPLETMMYAFMNMHKDIPDSLHEFIVQQETKLGIEKWTSIKKDFLNLMAVNPHSSVLEFVNTVWLMKGVTRAFQQQLTRTRMAAYSIQSLRIVDVKNFFTNSEFRCPPNLDHYSGNDYYDAMDHIEDSYRLMIEHGSKVEDARGILPLNIYSPITMAINLRALTHMLEARMCYLAQDEFREIAILMMKEIEEKMGKEFLVLFSKPCDKLHRCPMPVNCGKTQYKLDPIYKSMDLNQWLKGD